MFIPLDRHFVAIDKDTEAELAVESAWGQRYYGWLDWAALLDKSRVVLLAEASSGKSEEFKYTAAALRADDKPAFYITVERLADGGDVFDAPERKLIDAWKADTGIAWFFIDSVDEARLNQKKFDTGLRHLAAVIGPTINRARVFVSCRVSDWKGKSDRQTILDILPRPEAPPPPVKRKKLPEEELLDAVFEKEDPSAADAAETEKPKTNDAGILVVRLVPLTAEQRRRLAEGIGVQNVDGFLGAIEKMGLDALAERPGDIIELAQYWKQHAALGPLTEMTEVAVAAKLEEADRFRPDNTHLSTSKAREGAERLATAMTLGKTFSIIAPGQEPDPELSVGALDPALVLDNWTPAERNALLRRAIFAPSTYGRVRFHHRSTQEYLASCWLRRLREGGAQPSELFTLLFPDIYGVKTIAPSLRPAAAWLALRYADIRDEIIRREPLILITHGDPAALPGEIKSRVLTTLATRHANGEIADDSIDRRAIALFASPDLASAIREAWALNRRSDFRADLMRIVREGAITACADLALQAAINPKYVAYFRMTAVEALVACKARKELLSVKQGLMRNAAKLTPNLARRLLPLFFPDYLSVNELLTLIEKAEPQKESSTEGVSYVIEDLWKACPAKDKTALLAGLAKLCAAAPPINRHHRVSKRHAQLARNLGGIAHDAVSSLGAAAPSDALITLLSVVERAERPRRQDDRNPPLNALVRANSLIHRALFWFDVAEVRQSSSRPVQSLWDIFIGGSPLWELAEADIPWLLEDLSERLLPDDRMVALSALARIYGDNLKAEAPALRKRIGKDAPLRAELNKHLRPRGKSASMRRSEARHAKNQRKRQEQKAKDKESWRKFRDELIVDPTRLSTPAPISGRGFLGIHNLVLWLQRKTHKEPDEAALQWHMLADAFSKEVADSFALGMKALWRAQKPERPVRNNGNGVTVKWVTIYAYAAIGIEAAQDPGFANKLAPADAERAVEHACQSEQGYPDWLDAILAAYPAIAVPLVVKEFEAEWRGDTGLRSYFLHRYSQASPGIPAALHAPLFEIITGSVPANAEMLERGLGILRQITFTPAQRTTLASFAAGRHAAHAKTDIGLAARYIAILFLADAKAGATLLLKWLRGIKSQRKRQSAAITVLALLFGDHHALIRDALAALDVPMLADLLLFAYQTVRPEDDHDHGEGVYSPDARDDAEGARNVILKALIETGGPDAYHAMMRLSGRSDMRARRVRFRELARRMAERDADRFTWKPAEILAFENSKLLPVKTGTQLFALAHAITREIGWDFAHADASSRAVLETATDENAVQNYLAEQLRLRATGRFHATREGEVAEGNKPDILIASTEAPVEVALEAKHGGKQWSTKSLEAALRTQLAEDYLRPANRRHGLFVVTNHRPRGWTHPKSGKHLNFTEMIAYLATIAETLTKNAVGEIQVSVVGIDALPRERRRTKRSPSRSKTKARRKKQRSKISGRKSPK